MDLENPLERREACPFGVERVLGIGAAGGFVGVEWVLRRSPGVLKRMSCGIRSWVGLLFGTVVRALGYFVRGVSVV